MSHMSYMLYSEERVYPRLLSISVSISACTTNGPYSDLIHQCSLIHNHDRCSQKEEVAWVNNLWRHGDVKKLRAQFFADLRTVMEMEKCMRTINANAMDRDNQLLPE